MRPTGGVGTALLALGIVLGLAIGGQILATMAGTRLRGSVTSRFGRAADAAGGALVSVCGLLLGAWLIASLVVQVDATGGLSSRIRDSKVLTTVDEVIPQDADGIFQSFGDLLDSTGFPRVFGALAPERILPVDPPDPTIAADPAAPAQSLVKVVGIAEDCRQRLEGSGFVYAAAARDDERARGGWRRAAAGSGGRAPAERWTRGSSSSIPSATWRCWRCRT